MATQIPPPFHVPDPEEKDPPRDPGIPPAPEAPMQVEEAYQLPPRERIGAIREPRIPGA